MFLGISVCETHKFWKSVKAISFSSVICWQWRKSVFWSVIFWRRRNGREWVTFGIKVLLFSFLCVCVCCLILLSSFTVLYFVSSFSSVGFKFPLGRPLFSGFPSFSPCFFFPLVLRLRTRVSFVTSPSFTFLYFIHSFYLVSFKFPLRILLGFPSSSPCFFFSLMSLLRTRVIVSTSNCSSLSSISSPSFLPFFLRHLFSFSRLVLIFHSY